MFKIKISLALFQVTCYPGLHTGEKPWEIHLKGQSPSFPKIFKTTSSTAQPNRLPPNLTSNVTSSAASLTVQYKIQGRL